MDFWEPFYNQFGLERVLLDLKEYPEVFPLSDLLHMAMNWRVRLLRFLLTFVLDAFPADGRVRPADYPRKNPLVRASHSRWDNRDCPVHHHIIRHECIVSRHNDS
jgi:hypothetical protein